MTNVAQNKEKRSLPVDFNNESEMIFTAALGMLYDQCVSLCFSTVLKDCEYDKVAAFIRQIDETNETDYPKKNRLQPADSSDESRMIFILTMMMIRDQCIGLCLSNFLEDREYYETSALIKYIDDNHPEVKEFIEDKRFPCS